MILIKEASELDIKKLTEYLYNPVSFFLTDPKLEYPYHMQDWCNYFSTRQLLVLKEDENILGFIGYQSQENDSIIIKHLFVIPKYRKRSYGKVLVKHVLAKESSKHFSVEIQNEQREQIKLFSELGFIKTEKTDTYIYDSNKYTFVKLEMMTK